MSGPKLWQLEEFQPPALLDYVRNLLPEPSYIGNTYLPNKTHPDVEYQYLLGARKTPVMAHILGWDSTTPIGGRRGQAREVRGELPPIKRQMQVSEKEIIRFMQPRYGSADMQAAVDAIYDDLAQLVDSVFARSEWLRMQALSEKEVIYDESDVKIAFDFGIPRDDMVDLVTQTDGDGAPLEAGLFGPAWLNPDGSVNLDSTPITDLMSFCAMKERKHGQRPATQILSAKAQVGLSQNPQMKGWIYDQNAPNRPLLPNEINGLFAQYGLPARVEYDVRVGKEEDDGTITSVRCMRENQSVFLPSTPVGNALWGPTAESRQLIGTPYQQQAPGLWANVTGYDEPPSEWTKVVAVHFPTVPGAEHIGHMRLF